MSNINSTILDFVTGAIDFFIYVKGEFSALLERNLFNIDHTISK